MKFKKKHIKYEDEENWQMNLGGGMAIIAIIFFVFTFFNFNEEPLLKVWFSMGFVFMIASYFLLFLGYLKEKLFKTFKH